MQTFEVLEENKVKRPRSSHIPLPIQPAVTRPSKKLKEMDGSSYDGGIESFNSSSEGEYRTMFKDDFATTLTFLGPDLLRMLLTKEEWRGRVRGLDRLGILAKAGRWTREEATNVLRYLTNLLTEERSPRVVVTALRSLRSVVRVYGGGMTQMPSTVVALCKHLGPGSGVSVRLEAVHTLNTIIRIMGGTPVANVLTSPSCLGSSSSKVRENSLLCILYGLMTFPSTDFDCERLTEQILTAGLMEKKRRVRQAILDTLAVLAQFVPRAMFRPNSERQDDIYFAEAIHARLARKQLPTVSQDGLILYALQVSQSSGPDVEWILSGTGGLSSGSARSRAQLENAQRAFVSPTQSSENIYKRESLSREPYSPSTSEPRAGGSTKRDRQGLKKSSAKKRARSKRRF